MRIVTVALMVVVAVLSGCSQQQSPKIKDIAEIQRLARITIPASASNVHCATEHGIDSLVYGRFDIPAADLRLVIADMPASEKIMPYNGYSNVTSHKMSEIWWQPEHLKKRMVANWSKRGFAVNLLFGEAGQPALLTVYFFNFSM